MRVGSGSLVYEAQPVRTNRSKVRRIMVADTKPNGGPESNALLAAAAAPVFAGIWLRPGPALLYGTDAGVYARIARALAARPLSEWLDPRLGSTPFLDQPPLGLWLEALWIRCLGASPAALVGLARVYATLIALLV